MTGMGSFPPEITSNKNSEDHFREKTLRYFTEQQEY